MTYFGPQTSNPTAGTFTLDDHESDASDTEFAQFSALASKLFAVPKSEVDAASSPGAYAAAAAAADEAD